MVIDYRETTKDLLTRIDIHKRYCGKDIDAWMLNLLKPSQGVKVLDVGCGAGKQCFLYHEYCEGKADIVGGDVSDELLVRARTENATRGNPVRLMELDFNRRFPFPDGEFDLVSCCFAIYYADDIPFTIREMHRVLKPGGRLFATGPMPDNKKVFYEVIRKASGKPIPPMPGSSRFSSSIMAAMKETFARVDLHVFENPLTFERPEPFVEYTRASLSEDRRLWTSLFRGAEEFESLMNKIRDVVEERVSEDGPLVMTKVVGGAIATKAA
jgi:ubiquinone/menaquinone biosynthesis C-methylase UbiE